MKKVAFSGENFQEYTLKSKTKKLKAIKGN